MGRLMAAFIADPHGPAVVDLVAAYGEAAATLAADWYDDVRGSFDLPSSYSAPPGAVDEGTYRHIHGVIGDTIKTATSDETLAPLLLGGLQHVVSNVARFTVMGASLADPDTRGWRRQSARGGGCDFCKSLIGRGAVYSESSASFESHDRCGCIAVPDFA